MNAKRDPRRIRIGRIHQAAKALGLSEQEYRGLLVRASAGPDGLGGLDSCTHMTEDQHIAVLREMARLGFKADSNADRKHAYAGRPIGDRKAWRPMVRKVEALLADAKRPWAYAHDLAQHMFHVNRVEWLNDHDLHKLVSALQIDANRKKGTS